MPIVVSGPIAAGKSTLCKRLQEYYNISYLPEFDSCDVGRNLLRSFKHGEISGDTLQLFIADWWNHVSHHAIYERLPRESLLFAREQIEDKRLLPILEDLIKSAEEKLGVLNLPIVYVTNESFEEIVKIINEHNRNLCLFLRCPLAETKERAIKRDSSIVDNFDKLWYDAI